MHVWCMYDHWTDGRMISLVNLVSQMHTFSSLLCFGSNRYKATITQLFLTCAMNLQPAC